MVICPHCLKKITHAYTEINTVKRKQLILSNLSEPTKGEILYGRCRRQGYPMKRRTFQRDLRDMHKAKLLRAVTKRGGKGGGTTYIYPIER